MTSPNFAQGQSVAGHSASPDDYKYEDHQGPGESNSRTAPSSRAIPSRAQARCCEKIDRYYKARMLFVFNSANFLTSLRFLCRELA